MPDEQVSYVEEQHNQPLLDRINSCRHVYRVKDYTTVNGEFVKTIRVYTCIFCGVRTTVSWSEHI